MSGLEKHLDALTNRSNLQEAGVARPYSMEWDVASYPPKFKAPTLHTFDGKEAPNQHIYYFKFQTKNVLMMMPS